MADFSDLQAIANTALFRGRLGADVTYTAPGGVAQSVRGIFFERPVAVDGLDLAQSRILSSEIMLSLRQADLTAGRVEPGAAVVVKGVAYEVRQVDRPNDAGEVECSLRRVSGA